MNQKEINDLYSQFSGSGANNTSTGRPDIDALYNQFSGSSAAPAQTLAAPTPPASNIPQPFTPEQEAQAAAQPAMMFPNAPASVQGIERLFKSVGKSGLHVAREGNWDTLNIGKQFMQGGRMIGEGLTDIQSNRSATGVGKIGMGVLQAATSWASGPIESATDVVRGFTTNRAADQMGFGASLAIPVVPIGNKLRAALPSNKAIKSVVEDIGPENINAVVAAVRENPRLSIMDVAPGARMHGQGLAVTPGPHQRAFDNFVTERTVGAKSAVSDAYDSAMGMSVNAHTKLNELKKAARNVGTNAIEPAIAGSKPVNIQPVLDYITGLEKPGVNTVFTAGQPLPSTELVKALVERRKFLTDGKSSRTDPKSLHQFQSAIRAEADNLLNSSQAGERSLGHGLMQFRNQLVNQIDEASGGTYKNALGKYRDEMEIQAAFDRGYQLNRNRINGSVWDDHPDFVEQWVKTLSPQELQAAREGARLGFRDLIGKANDPRGQKGTQIVNNEYNLEKASMLFSNGEINAMTKKLRDERNIAQTNQDLMHGSQTAMRQGAQQRIPQPIDPTSNPGKKDVLPLIASEAIGAYTTGSPGIGAAVYSAGRLASYLGDRFVRTPTKNSMIRRENAEAGRLLQATAADDVVLNRLLDYASTVKPRLGQRIGNALSKAVTPLIP